MSRRAKTFGFGREEIGARFPAYASNGHRGGRHAAGLGLRISRYVGKHRGLEQADGHPAVSLEKPRRSRKVKDYGFGS